MGSHGASAPISREGSFFKPPVLVRDRHVSNQYPPHILIYRHRNAILSLYHIRPVPAWMDGRPEEEKNPPGAPLRSLWLDGNKPGMYPAAAKLHKLGFRSRDTTLAILNQCKPVHDPCATRLNVIT